MGECYADDGTSRLTSAHRCHHRKLFNRLVTKILVYVAGFALGKYGMIKWNERSAMQRQYDNLCELPPHSPGRFRWCDLSSALASDMLIKICPR